MKNCLFIFSLLLCQIVTAQTDPILDLEDIVCKERAHAEHFLSPHSRNEFAGQTDIHYQVMKWEINPADYYIKGEIDYYFKSLIPGLDQLVLDFTNVLPINSIRRNGVDLAYTHTPDQLLHIQLGKSLGEGAFDTLTINYEGAPPSNGFGSFEQGTHQDTPVIWTLSEPYGVRDWWPAKQDLIDKIDSVDIFITTPPGNLAASNGKLMSITEADGKLLHHWKHRYPIASYLVALAVTNYEAYSQYAYLTNGDSIEVLNYIYPEHVNAAKEATKLTVDFIGFFNELFGLYPFAEEKYGHAQFGWGGGMEHQTMSFMGSFNYDLQAHELAHQWFGDKVTTGSWQDIWLNEGFATYLTGLSYERFSPEQYWPIWKTSVSNSATSNPGGSVWVDDTTSVNRIFSGRLSYSKGAYVLHMARWVTNDDSTYFRAIRNYLNAPDLAYGFARTNDLKFHLENTTGIDFDAFLADWYYGQGWPSYHLRWTQEADSLIVFVSQDQSHPSVPFFEMPIPIYVRTNADETIYRLNHTQEDQRFSIFIGDAVVDSLAFDPEKWILSRNNTVAEITTSIYHPYANDAVTLYPNPASDIIEIISPNNVSTVEAINALGQINSFGVSSSRVDISHLQPAVYMLILKDRENKVMAVKRILVAR